MNMINNKEHDIYCTVDNAINELKKGKPIIITDNEDRENEGDLIYPAENITPEIMAFIIKYTSGLICCAMHHTMIDNLKLPHYRYFSRSLTGSLQKMGCSGLPQQPYAS